MAIEIIALHCAVFAASLLQAASGIGFGVLAGPALLLVLNSGGAIQISILLSLLIALLLSPGLWGRVNRTVFRHLLVGTGLGIPLGLVVFMVTPILLLKTFAMIAVLFMLWVSMRSTGVRRAESVMTAGVEGVGIGTVSGLMGASLGMPGPVVAAWMTARQEKKQAIRATILVLFVPSYVGAFLVQQIAGVDEATLWLCLQLLPATLAGVLIGKQLDGRISDSVFRRVIKAVLLMTAMGLAIDITIRFSS